MVTRNRIAATRLYLSEWMEERGETDKTLAGKLSVSRVTVTRYREQQHRLDVEKIARLAKALDVEPEQLWRPPGRPSVDVVLKNASDEFVRRTAESLAILLKSER